MENLRSRMRTDTGALRLNSGAPFWLLSAGLEELSAPQREAADVAIIGAGITGALVADALTAEGLRVVLLDRRAPAYGSTAASTALLQYEIDTELHELIERVGERDAVRAYQLGVAAIDRLEAICTELPDNCGFARRGSLYLASRRRDRRRLESEFRARTRFGFDVQRWSQDEVKQHYGFPGHGALYTSVAAVVDPVRLTRALLRRACGRGAALLSRTTVLEVEPTATGVRLNTDRGAIEAGQVVYAMGYEIPPCLRKELVSLHSSFALVTEPVEQLGPWEDECLVWETARPYTYIRVTPDRRILCGGVDSPFRDADLRDQLLPNRIRRLEHHLAKLLPSLELTTAYTWAGTFGETRDGLPFIGPSAAMPGSLFALGYGGNGITFGVIAAEILRDLCLGHPNDDARIFRLDR
jgi:glycine/D-amino acid oxidase-like deaminating enzyme